LKGIKVPVRVIATSFARHNGVIHVGNLRTPHVKGGSFELSPSKSWELVSNFNSFEHSHGLIVDKSRLTSVEIS
jgi:hypothetical protein